jgi:hypothetical protein
MRELAKSITDERALQAAVALAIEYERQVETMADHRAATLEADAVEADPLAKQRR